MAYKILQSYQHLAVARDGEGLTGLHFLASISTAFPSGSRLGVLRRFIYNCMHSHLSSFLILSRVHVNVYARAQPGASECSLDVNLE